MLLLADKIINKHINMVDNMNSPENENVSVLEQEDKESINLTRENVAASLKLPPEASWNEIMAKVNELKELDEKGPENQ